MEEIQIVAILMGKAEYKEELEKHIYKLVDETRKEEGNISYNLYLDIAKPLKYTILETWQSEAAVDLHNASSHFQEFVNSIEGKYESLDISVMKKIY